MPSEMECPATPPQLPTDATPERVKLSPVGGGHSPTSPGRASPDSACPICLGKLENKAFTDGCSHKFCFTCILEWSKVRAVCPLCKQGFTSIMHNVRSELDYDRYRLPAPAPTEQQPPQHPYIYRPGEGGPAWLQARRHYRHYRSLVLPMLWPIPGEQYHLPPAAGGRSTRLTRGRVTSHSRRALYLNDQWARPTADSLTGRYRETGPEFYRSNPACTHRLIPWLNRELNAVLDQPSFVAQVLELIMDCVTRMHILSTQFRALLEPFISPNTEHFIHEFYSYARSPYDMVGYDLNVQYRPGRPPPPTEPTAISSDSPDDSDDSEILVISPPPRPRTPILEERISPEPGPSGISVVHLDRALAFLNTMQATEALPDSSGSDTDDAVQVLNVVPPRNMREYETVTLSSDDDAPPTTSTLSVAAEAAASIAAAGDSRENEAEGGNEPVAIKSKIKSSSRRKDSKSAKRKDVDSRNKVDSRANTSSASGRSESKSKPSSSNGRIDSNSRKNSSSSRSSGNRKTSSSNRHRNHSSRSESTSAALSRVPTAAEKKQGSSSSATDQTAKHSKVRSSSSKSRSHTSKSSSQRDKERRDRAASKTSSITQSVRANGEEKRTKKRHDDKSRSRHHKRCRLSSDPEDDLASEPRPAGGLSSASRGASMDSVLAPSTSSVPSTSSGATNHRYHKQLRALISSDSSDSDSDVITDRRASAAARRLPAISESDASSDETVKVRRPAMRSAVVKAAGAVSSQLFSCSSDSDW